MEEKVVNQLLKAREALQTKLKSLKSDIATAKRSIDIHYAPIAEPLKEIAMKLDNKTSGKGKTFKDSLLDSNMVETYSDLAHEKSFASIPGTSIVRHFATPSRRKHVSWFSPGIHSSPTKLQITKQNQMESSRAVGTPSIAQPSFLEDDYIGSYLPETPTPVTSAKDYSDDHMEDEEDTSGSSMDLDKSMAHALSLLQTKPTKSIISNKSLNKTVIDTEAVKESLKNHHPLVRPYLIGLMTDEKEEYDNKYGVRESAGTLKVGTATVEFDDGNILIGKFRYAGTRGLYELLFKKNPGKFTFADAKNYKYILQNTNAYKVNYKRENKIAGSKAFKYKNIIKPILEGKPPQVWWTRHWKIGAGIKHKKLRVQPITLSKVVNPNIGIEYKYWDNVNELRDRLQLLAASKEAGHTGHDNEIIAILEELKEAKVIK